MVAVKDASRFTKLLKSGPHCPPLANPPANTFCPMFLAQKSPKSAKINGGVFRTVEKIAHVDVPDDTKR
jgi:hypothetical protein